MVTVITDTFGRIAAQFHRDRSRWFLFSPIFVGAGIALYFHLSWHPGGIWLVASVILLGLWLLTGKMELRALRVMIAMALLISVGFSASILRDYAVAAPVLQKKITTTVIGTVLEKSAGVKSRLLLGELSFKVEQPLPDLRYVRISARGKNRSVQPGDIITAKAVLLPPPPPAYPGGFDFQRHSYYQSIGAVGYTFGKVAKVREATGSWAEVLRFSSEMRTKLAEFVVRNGPSDTSGFIVALLTGDKGAIPTQQLDDMRHSGLAHLLAISGLHMGMIGGLIFFISRLAYASWPYFALNYPIKKIAAVTALVGLACYLFVSGMSVSAVRAFIMISAFFIAVLADRNALSFRMVVIAALIILILFPESLVSASFQMSFAAVFALIAFYEAIGGRLARLARSGGPFRRLSAYILGIILTSLVAGLATAPFALYHFGQVAAYSLAANLLSVPIMGLWVMPWAIATFLTLPFNISLPLDMMGLGIDAILLIAHETASWPDAVQYLGSYSAPQLLAITLISLWLVLWRQPIRWLALPAAVLLSLSFAFVSKPDILISNSGNLYAIYHAGKGTYFSSRRIEKFDAERWQLIVGTKRWASQDIPLSCDAYGCIYKRGSRVIAFPKNGQGAEEDCARADIILSRVPIFGDCPDAQLVIDKFDLWRNGAHSLHFKEGSEISIKTVNGLRRDRPWVPVRYRDQKRK